MTEIWVALGTIGGAGLIAWGEMRGKVSGLRSDIDEKANKETVNAHFEAVIQRLERIETKLDRNSGIG